MVWLGAGYPANNDWYNEYWDDDDDSYDGGGWQPLAKFMQGLIRVGNTSHLEINGAALDLTENAIESLGFTFNETWSDNVYWRKQ